MAAVVLALLLAADAGVGVTKAEAKEWTVAARAVGRTRLEIVVTARAGFHINPDYPARFTPRPTPGVQFEKEKVARQQATLTLSVGFAALEPGPREAAGKLAFSVCDPNRCLIEKVDLAVPLNDT